MSILVKNLMEDIVSDKLDSLLPKLKCCTCEICRTDILCYALNRLPTKYVATSTGERLSKSETLSASFNIRVITELTNASEIVKQHPRHPID